MEEKLFVKEKLVLLVVEIAKREWPQRWSGMLEYLTQIAQLGVRSAKFPAFFRVPNHSL